MRFLYPEHKQVTHIVARNVGLVINYPEDSSQELLTQYAVEVDKYEEIPDSQGNLILGNLLSDGCGVCLIRENVGPLFKWSYVKVVDPIFESAEYYNKEFYILTENLRNIGEKEMYSSKPTKKNEINKKVSPADPTLKELFTPYIDRNEGLLSVRLQVDYDRILDMVSFNRILEEVYIKGVGILLSSMRSKSGIDSINELRNKYYTFAYINRDLDITIIRECEPLTFTVSIPLSFFEKVEPLEEQASEKPPVKYTIQFSNFDIGIKLNNLLKILTSRTGDIQNLLYPSKILKNFLVDIELDSIKRFAVGIIDFFTFAEAPVDANSEFLTEYFLELDENYELIGIKVKKYDNEGFDEIIFKDSLIAQAYFDGKFYNKRIFNYLLRLPAMEVDVTRLEIYDFIKKHVKFPDVNLEEEQISINNQDVPPEIVSEFMSKYAQSQEACISVKDIQNLLRSSGDLIELGYGVAYGAGLKRPASGPASGLYDFFIPNNPSNFPNVRENFTNMQKNFNRLKFQVDLRTSTDVERFGILAVLNKAEQEDPNYKKSILGITEQFKTQMFFSSAKEGVKKFGGGVVDGFVEQLQKDIKLDNLLSSDAVNNVIFLLRRINIHKILFTQIFCALKGAGTSPELARQQAEVWSSLPDEVARYLRHMDSVKEMKGWRYIRAVESGISFDWEFYCNDEFTYMLKGLVNLVGNISATLQRSVSFLSELDKAVAQYAKRKTGSGGSGELFKEIGSAVGKALYDTLTQIFYDFVIDLLTAECEDPVFNQPSDHFGDPFSSHSPIPQFNTDLNYDPDTIKLNRQQSLIESMPEVFEETQGIDIEYTVDVLELLMRDLRCLLSPIECVNLLRGEPSQQVIVLIKNLIKNKYSKDPNNLSYLLEGDKIYLLFQSFGKRADQNLLNNIVEAERQIQLETGKSYEDVCGDKFSKLKKDLFNGKIPEDLGVLDDHSSKRIERAKKLLEELKKPNTVLNVSALCADSDDENIRNIKTKLVNQYTEPVMSLFTPVLDVFNMEADGILRLYKEPKLLIRRDGDGRIFEKYEYVTYNSSFQLNLESANNNNLFSQRLIYRQPSDLIKQDSFIKYMPKERSPLSNKEIADSFFNYKEGEQFTICTGSFQENPLFVEFLTEGRIVFENRPVPRDWSKLDLKYQKIGYNDSSKSEFFKNLEKYTPDFLEYFKEKKSLLFISVEGEQIFFRHIYFDVGSQDFRLLEKIEYEEILPPDPDFIQNKKKNNRSLLKKTLQVYTGEILVDYGIEQYSGEAESFDYSLTWPWKKDGIYVSLTEVHNYYYSGIKKFYPPAGSDAEDAGRYGIGLGIVTLGIGTLIEGAVDLIEGDQNKRYGLHVLSDSFLTLKDAKPAPFQAKNSGDATYGQPVPRNYPDPVNTLNVIQEAVNLSVSNYLQTIDVYEASIGSFSRFLKGGLFHISSSYNSISKELVKNVAVATTGKDSKDVTYRNYYSFKNSLEEKISLPLTKVASSIIYNDISKHAAKMLEKKNFSSYIFIGGGEEELKSQAYKIYPRIKFVVNDEEADLLEKKGDVRPKSEEFLGNFKNKGLDVVKDESWVDNHEKTYSKITKLNITNDNRFRNCNIVPHYLNLNYFMNKALNEAKSTICDDNILEKPYEMIDIVLVNLTVRAIITDLLTRSIPILSLFNAKELGDIYKEQLLVDILRNHMRLDMHEFSTFVPLDDPQDYYTSFIESKVKPIYLNISSGEYSIPFDQKFALETGEQENFEIDYFIRKEIKHFIDYSLSRDLFFANDKLITNADLFGPETVSQISSSPFASVFGAIREATQLVYDPKNSLYQKFLSPLYQDSLKYSIEEFLGGGTTRTEFFGFTSTTQNTIEATLAEIVTNYSNLSPQTKQKIIKTEIFNIFSYNLMANTVDSKKRNLFGGTRNELSKVFFSTMNLQDSTNFFPEENKGDATKFIQELAFSANPAMSAQLNPNYMKYVMFFLEAIWKSTKQIIGTVAATENLNILITKLTSQLLAIAGSFSFAFADEETRKNWFAYHAVNGNYLMYWTLSRFRDVKSVLPEIIISPIWGFIIKIWPDVKGWVYLAMDTIDEAYWTFKNYQEYDALRQSLIDAARVDPCALPPSDAEYPVCTIETKENLIKEIDSYERGDMSYDENSRYKTINEKT